MVALIDGVNPRPGEYVHVMEGQRHGYRNLSIGSPYTAPGGAAGLPTPAPPRIIGALSLRPGASMRNSTLARIADGRTDLVFEHLAAGLPANATDANGVSLLRDVRTRGDSPLSWASWHQRPKPILEKLCYGSFRIHPDYAGMEAHLRGRPHD